MKTLLVVDDSRLILETAKYVLGSEYRVVPFMAGQEALTYLKSGECDIILLDINMPEMDGFELLARIREIERCRSIPVVFLTSDSDAETETRCFREGAADFIAKPIVPDVTLSRIGRILELEDLRHSLADKLAQKTREVSVIKSKSYHDALTGLWNREYTEKKVNELLERGTRGALLMMDMDNFKSINDKYGHMAGDNVLKMFADTLRNILSEEDILCRLGGDEFMVFIKDATSKNELGACAVDVISDLHGKIADYGYDTNTSLSIGIAQAPEDGNEFAKLYNSADKALYYVKENGKNSYHFFGDHLLAEKKRGGKIIDVKYLQDLLRRTDNGNGPYLLNYESFHHVFNFISRLIDRNNGDVQMLLFTVCENENIHLDAEEVEPVLELLEKVVYDCVRRADVITRYSNKQLIVLLTETTAETGNIVMKRIVEDFNRRYAEGKVRVEGGIARVGNPARPILRHFE